MCAARHAYISKQNVTRRFRLLCRGVNSICGRQAKYTKKPFSQLKQTEFYGICGKRSAAEYTQSEIMLANWQALLRSICGRQAKYTKKPFSQLKQTEFYGICGKRSAAEYTKKWPRAAVCAVRHIYLQIECDKAAPFALPRREQYMWPSGQIYEEAADLKIFKSAASFVPRTGLEPAHHL